MLELVPCLSCLLWLTLVLFTTTLISKKEGMTLHGFIMVSLIILFGQELRFREELIVSRIIGNIYLLSFYCGVV